MADKRWKDGYVQALRDLSDALVLEHAPRTEEAYTIRRMLLDAEHDKFPEPEPTATLRVTAVDHEAGRVTFSADEEKPSAETKPKRTRRTSAQVAADKAAAEAAKAPRQTEIPGA